MPGQLSVGVLADGHFFGQNIMAYLAWSILATLNRNENLVTRETRLFSLRRVVTATSGSESCSREFRDEFLCV